MKKQTQGGKRSNAGRKPVADPKKGITIYVESSIIEANNGIEECKSEMYFFLKERAEKKLKTLSQMSNRSGQVAMEHNGFGLGEVGDLKAQSLNLGNTFI